MSEQPTDRRHQGAEIPPGVGALLDELVTMVENARTMPMSSSVLVHRGEALGLIDEIRDGLPDEIERADETLKEAEQALADANRDAEDIVRTARARAIELVQAEQVVVQARSQAHEIVEEAEATAAELRADADDYCDRRLADFEIDLGKILSQVQAGRARLAQRRDDV
ncbi:hypothetical protein [Paraoerskovia marina]|uniref:Cell division septum initiation DivIVA, interacts with FtsZ, MinD n=1 Tax=Paraoerskovia marina TaxID=545619 RepID=A0A1H1RKE1_9CELL|nr:hypothetical protein [Paraoerskovia marina]SDS36221.1 hypothetical protein SAMN04489860_1382 [Paraoerskovia marina]